MAHVSRRRRIVRWTLRVGVATIAFVVSVAVVALLLIRTGWFKDQLRSVIVRQANQHLVGSLSIDRVSGDLLSGIHLENISIVQRGRPVVTVRDLRVEYNLRRIVSKGLTIDAIHLDRPVVHLWRGQDGWSIAHLVSKGRQQAAPGGPGRAIAINAIAIVDGSIAVDEPIRSSNLSVPATFDRLDAQLSMTYEPTHSTVNIGKLSFRGSDPAIELSALSGTVTADGATVRLQNLKARSPESSFTVEGAVRYDSNTPDLDLRVMSDVVSLPELARVFPAIGRRMLRPAIDVKLTGPPDRLAVVLQFRSSAGDVDGNVVMNLHQRPQSMKGRVSVRRLDLAPLLDNPDRASDITATATIALRGERVWDFQALDGTVDFTTPDTTYAGFSAQRARGRVQLMGRSVTVDVAASAYGAAVTATGSLAFPLGTGESFVYDLRGSARQVDLRRLPPRLRVPPAEAIVNVAAYHVQGATFSAANRPARASGDVRLEQSSVAGAKIAAGTTVKFDGAGREMKYQIDAVVSGLDIERIGREFAMPAVATQRYESRVNGHLVAAIQGTTVKTLTITAAGEIGDSSLFGVRLPELSFTTAIADNAAQVTAKGRVAALDLDPVSVGFPRRVEGAVSGTFAVDATFSPISNGLSLDNVEASVTAALEPSTVAGLAIEHARIDGDYRPSAIRLRTLDVVGPALTLTASGTVVLDDRGQSNLTIHANSMYLDQIAKLAGVSADGIATIDGVVTGNRRELQMTGRAIVDSLTYGNYRALTVTTDYTARVPDMALGRAELSLQPHATFVTMGDQRINQVEGKIEYANQRAAFDLTAAQPQRTLNAAGSFVIRGDHQELEFRRLSLQAPGLGWQLATDARQTIRFGGGAVTVLDLELASAGSQRVTVEGSFGVPGETLSVTLANIDASAIDALLARPPTFFGRLNAKATVAGTAGEPSIDTGFTLAGGAVGRFHFESLTGTASYRDAGLTFDTTLRESSTESLTAKGHLPRAAFWPQPGGEVAAASVPVADRFDLHVESTPFDLGLLQGFTSALTEVSGLVQANVDITGTVADPQPTGIVTVKNAAFRVVPTGVKYTGLDGQIDLQADRIHIDEIRVLDDRHQPLLVTGDLAIRRRTVGSLNIALKSDRFQVIDNDVGDLRVKSNLRIGGELRAPRLEGDLELSSGTIELDTVLAKTRSVYSVSPGTPVTATVAGPAAAAPAAALSVFDALSADVHLTIPNALVVKADDLRASGAPLGLGAVTVALGGDVQITKQSGDATRLLGYLNTVRGFYDFQGRRFTIVRGGSVQFENQTLDTFDPRIDVNAQRVIQGVTANVWVGGTLKKPDVQLTSTPPLDQADVLALIVFNQPLNQLGESQQISLSNRAKSIATGAIAGQLGRSLASSLKLNQFEINLAPDSGNAELTVGQQLGQNFFVQVQRSVSGQSLTNLVVEYAFTPWLSLRTNVLQSSSVQQQLFQRVQGSGIDLLFSFGLNGAP